MIRRLAALALLLIGVWLGYQAASSAGAYASRGAGWGAVLTDPAFMLRLVGAFLVALGGLLASLGRPGGAFLALFGTISLAILTVGIIMSGGSSTLWRDDAALCAVLLILTLPLFFLRRR